MYEILGFFMSSPYIYTYESCSTSLSPLSSPLLHSPLSPHYLVPCAFMMCVCVFALACTHVVKSILCMKENRIISFPY